MWNQPTTSIATTVEKWFADAEQAQPNTTVQLTMYNLVHSNIDPSAIQSQYEAWISQFAQGLGNNRAVIYLEEDALITMPRVTPAQRKVRLAEIAYAVNALEQDPHVVVYIDAGASDTLITPRRYARMLKASGVAHAQGFSVNSTHHEWVTSEIHFGQQISRYLGGAHFVVQTGSAGRGPTLNPHPKTQGVEDLCNPSGTGLGPLTLEHRLQGRRRTALVRERRLHREHPMPRRGTGSGHVLARIRLRDRSTSGEPDHRTEIPADQVHHQHVTARGHAHRSPRRPSTSGSSPSS